MNPGIKNRWITALRSGEYSQGQRYLYSEEDGGYCCLGVLCELAKDAGIVSSITTIYKTRRYQAIDYPRDYSETILPLTVQIWAGLPEGNPSFGDDPEIYGLPVDAEFSLAELNDRAQWDFEKIADFIESKL